MYFEVNSNGRILVCAEESVNSRMVWLEVPADFHPETMCDWRIEGEALVYDPIPVVESPSLEERIAALQKQVDEQAAMIVAYESAYMEGVQQA